MQERPGYFLPERHVARYFEMERIEANGTTVLMVRAIQKSVFTSDKIQECMKELDAIAGPNRVVLNLSGLDLVGSAFIGGLIKLHMEVQKSGGHLCICGSSQALMYLVEVLRLDRMIQMLDSETDAIATVTKTEQAPRRHASPSPPGPPLSGAVQTPLNTGQQSQKGCALSTWLKRYPRQSSAGGGPQ